MPINSSTLRLTWAVVEEASPNDLLTLSDTMLIKLLLQHIAQKILLSGEEVYTLYDYIGSKVSLIRDLAESRLIQENQLLERRFIAEQSCLLSPSQLAAIVRASA
jgi:hypothetical protein